LKGSDLASRIAREGRETSILLHTRCRFLRDHLGTLMNLICRYDAGLERLARLAGPEGKRILADLEVAAREVDRDGMLAEMLYLLDRSAGDAAELEELAAAAEAMVQEGDAEIDLGLWAEGVARDVQCLPGGRVTVDWKMEPSIPPLRLPRAVPPVLAGALRALAEGCQAPSVMELRFRREGEGVSVQAVLQPRRQARPTTWTPCGVEDGPAVVRLGRGFLRHWGGDLILEGAGEGPAPGLRLSATLPVRPIRGTV